ncbi:hypothetical protein [Roseomonas sp. AR75]|uniref:hypothetical protein n=1 Tax=Roseomonas sp. AR75 TaxID=2562311 RepID=UPI0010C0C7A2|nr:hypothetical protein [Roseomonas sp. AR75]
MHAFTYTGLPARVVFGSGTTAKLQALNLALCASIGVFLPSAVVGQSAGGAASRLRDISPLQVSVAFLPEPSTGAPCTLDRNGLEAHAASSLRTAGLQVLTGAETFARAREQLRLSQEEVAALRARRATPAPSATEQQERMAEHKFLQTISSLTVVFHATAFEREGVTTCAVAYNARFLARPAGRPALAVNGRQVDADLLLWERQARSFVIQEQHLAEGVSRHLDTLLASFLGSWRRANER